MLGLRNITFMTADPSALAAFWASALGLTERRDGEHEIILAQGDWGFPRLTFQLSEGRSESGQPLHLDSPLRTAQPR